MGKQANGDCFVTYVFFLKKFHSAYFSSLLQCFIQRIFDTLAFGLKNYSDTGDDDESVVLFFRVMEILSVGLYHDINFCFTLLFFLFSLEVVIFLMFYVILDAAYGKIYKIFKELIIPSELSGNFSL